MPCWPLKVLTFGQFLNAKTGPTRTGHEREGEDARREGLVTSSPTFFVFQRSMNGHERAVHLAPGKVYTLRLGRFSAGRSMFAFRREPVFAQSETRVQE